MPRTCATDANSHACGVALVIVRDRGWFLDYAPFGAPLGMTHKKKRPLTHKNNAL
jgi:hypothetical protein